MTGAQDSSSLISALEAEYDPDTGFLGQLRQGIFDPAGLDRLVALLESIHVETNESINRRLVALLWLIPTIMGWQVPRVAEHGGDISRLQRGIDRVQEALNSVLGMP